MNAIPQPVMPAIDLTDPSVFRQASGRGQPIPDDVRRELVRIAGSPAGIAA
jgi:hypothetical protein